MIGSRLGSWIIEEEIGRGGMGTVYRAHRTSSQGDEICAIKMLAAELAVELGFQQRFQREIEILRQLNHPNIVRFLESGVEESRFWYAMELIQGESYEDLRLQSGRLHWREVLEMAWQIAPALKHAHDRGVIHRDLKPSNLLRNEEGTVKLTDFGIASLFASPHLTVTGGVIGTPEFLSPEQASGKPVTKRSDLYSLGVVLYTLVTGKTPFEGEQIDLLHKHQYGQYERISRLVPDLHPDFEEIIDSLLEKDPGKRPGDAGVLFKRLDSLRKKLARQTQESLGMSRYDLKVGEREGPATLMSRLVRQELEQQNRPGPIGRILNHPVVLVTLFLLCVSTLVYTFWPMSESTLFERGAALMASDDPDDWDRAFERYFNTLEKKYPNHCYKQELTEFRQRLEEARAGQRAEGRAFRNRRLSDGEWFFEKGMRLRLQGEEEAACRIWEALIDAYRNVPSERAWVRRAERELANPPPPQKEPLRGATRAALEQAKQLEVEGKHEQANAIRRALGELYKDDPSMAAKLKK